jgi:hypothetical protein
MHTALRDDARARAAVLLVVELSRTRSPLAVRCAAGGVPGVPCCMEGGGGLQACGAHVQLPGEASNVPQLATYVAKLFNVRHDTFQHLARSSPVPSTQDHNPQQHNPAVTSHRHALPPPARPPSVTTQTETQTESFSLLCLRLSSLSAKRAAPRPWGPREMPPSSPPPYSRSPPRAAPAAAQRLAAPCASAPRCWRPRGRWAAGRAAARWA